MQKKALPLPPEYQILRTPMTETPKHTINTCTEAYVSCTAVLVVAACSSLLTHIYSVCVSPATCVGTALRGDTGRNKFPCGYSDFRMPIPVCLDAHRDLCGCPSKFMQMPIEVYADAHRSLCGYPSRFMRMPIRFYLNTNAYLSSTYKRYFSPQNKFNKHFN